MRYAIIASKTDRAGMNIHDALLRLYKFEAKDDFFELGSIRLYAIGKESIHAENIDKKIGADIFIFATQHRSEAGRDSLSVHVPGNWAKAEMGGREKTLCIAPASLVKEMFIELNGQGKELKGFEITLETVHHGPYLEKPCMFIEIGSSEKAWNNRDAGEVIAKTIMSVITKPVKPCKAVIAFGASHYPLPFNKFLLRTEYAIGQICPKYMLEKLDEDMVKQAFEKNVEKIEFALLDRKGMGGTKEKIKEILENLKIPYKKVQEFI